LLNRDSIFGLARGLPLGSLVLSPGMSRECVDRHRHPDALAPLSSYGPPHEARSVRNEAELVKRSSSDAARAASPRRGKI
jgi:hypothetical protein